MALRKSLELRKQLYAFCKGCHRHKYYQLHILKTSLNVLQDLSALPCIRCVCVLSQLCLCSRGRGCRNPLFSCSPKVLFWHNWFNKIELHGGESSFLLLETFKRSNLFRK